MAKHKKTWFGYGNRATRIAHVNNPGDACRISEVLPENRVYFETPAQLTTALENQSFRACKICASEYDPQ